MEAAMKLKKKGKWNIRDMSKIALLGAISFVIMFFEIPLPFAPVFYKVDLSEVVVLIGAFAMGPMAGFLIEFLKVALHIMIKGTTTAGVGDFANLLIGCGLVMPAAFLYRRRKTMKTAVLGMAVGIAVMAAVGGVLNAFVLLPVYAAAFQMPIDALVAMGTQINPRITGLSTFVLWAVVPFNILKGVLDAVLTMALYKKVSPVLHG